MIIASPTKRAANYMYWDRCTYQGYEPTVSRHTAYRFFVSVHKQVSRLIDQRMRHRTLVITIGVAPAIKPLLKRPFMISPLAPRK